jgi:hypothetical protein
VIEAFVDVTRSLDLSAVDAAAVPAIFPEPVDARMEESAA